MTTGVETLAARWAWWHAEREEKLRQPHGWLSLTGLHWLTESGARFPGVPGTWSVEGDLVTVRAEAAEELLVAGRVLDGSAQVRIEPDGSVLFAEFGGAAVEVIERGGRHGIRIRDPHSPVRTAFTGVPAFPVRSDWVLDARLERYPAPREVVVQTAHDGLTGIEVAVGEVVFTAAGAHRSLVAFADGEDGITLIFGDATNGISTAPWRALWAQLAEDDTVVLDFNRTVNFPSAFSAFGTCPKPPAGNILDIAVEAGERTPVLPH